MGCVPSEKRQSAAAATISSKKIPSLKQIEVKSRNSSTSTDKNHLKVATDYPTSDFPRKLGSKKEGSGDSSPKFKSDTGQENQNLAQNRKLSVPKKSQKPIIRVIPPVTEAAKSVKIGGELSRLASVHSLDINSRIKIPQGTSKKIVQQKPPEPNCEQINITFNNNNFAVHNSAAKSLGMGKRWREETLRQELRGMNDEHFRKIAVSSMPFN